MRRGYPVIIVNAKMFKHLTYGSSEAEVASRTHYDDDFLLVHGVIYLGKNYINAKDVPPFVIMI